jgi:GNAT superfamily N-acetyltransferase
MSARRPGKRARPAATGWQDQNVELTAYTTVPPEPVLDGCVTVYRAAFGQPPYDEPPGEAGQLRDRVARYAGRDGFRLPVLSGPDGAPAGFALGVTAHPGDWWRDKVAAAVGAAAALRWLGPSCLEIVHVAVLPGEQRRGIGRRLMAALLAPPVPPTGVLSCHPAADSAQNFYLALGWQVITDGFRLQPGQAGYWLMGLDLPPQRGHDMKGPVTS